MVPRSAGRFKAQWLFALIISSLLMSSLLQRYLGGIMDEPDLDFYDYYFEAAMVHDHPHTDMYSAAMSGNPQLRHAPPESEVYQRAEAAGFNGTNLYLYPPLLADLLIPLSTLPPHLAAMLWRCFNLFLVFGCAVLLTRFLGLSLISAEAGLLLFACFTFWPVHETIAQGQISIVLLGLWTIAVVAYGNGNAVLSAACLALATWLKVTPVLVLPLFLIWNDRKWIASYLSTASAFGLLVVWINGWQNLLTSFKVLLGMSGSVPAFPNKCIGALLAWFYYGKAATYDEARVLIANPQPHGLLITAKVLSLGFYAACMMMVWRRRSEKPVLRAMTIAVFAIVISLTSPVSWRHGYSAAAILLIILWVQCLRKPAAGLRLWLLALTTLSLGSLFFDLAIKAPLPDMLKIACSGTWVVFSVLLCLEVLWNGFYPAPDQQGGGLQGAVPSGGQAVLRSS